MKRTSGTIEQRANLEKEMDAIAELVANGDSMQEAGRKIGIDRNRSCKVWKRVRARLGEQAI